MTPKMSLNGPLALPLPPQLKLNLRRTRRFGMQRPSRLAAATDRIGLTYVLTLLSFNEIAFRASIAQR